MKKTIFILFLILLTGCGNTTSNIDNSTTNELSNTIEVNEDGALYLCKKDAYNEEEKYNLGGKYAIFADKDNNVTRINSVEIVESNYQEKLNYFESYLISNYDKISVYNGYEYDISLENNKVIAKVNINYNEFNLESYAVDYPEIQTYLTEDNKLKAANLVSLYKDLGITCTKK